MYLSLAFLLCRTVVGWHMLQVVNGNLAFTWFSSLTVSRFRIILFCNRIIVFRILHVNWNPMSIILSKISSRSPLGSMEIDRIIYQHQFPWYLEDWYTAPITPSCIWFWIGDPPLYFGRQPGWSIKHSHYYKHFPVYNRSTHKTELYQVE